MSAFDLTQATGPTQIRDRTALADGGFAVLYQDVDPIRGTTITATRVVVFGVSGKETPWVSGAAGLG